MSDEELIRRGDALIIAQGMNNGETAKAIARAIAALPAVTVRYTQADIGKIAAIIAEDDPFGVGAAAIAKAGCILAALEPVALTPTAVDYSQPANPGVKTPDPAAIREAALREAVQGLVEVLDQNETKGPLPDVALMLCWLAAQEVRAVMCKDGGQ